MTLFAWIRNLFRKEATGGSAVRPSSPAGAPVQPAAGLSSAGPSSPDPYGVARNHLGVREIPGAKNNPLIVRWHRRLANWINDDETAWCSSFANYCAAEAGYESSGKLDARSWLHVGQPVNLADARPGDVVVLWRGNPNSWTGHVAFLEHYNAKRGLLYLLGGNQNNEVNITAYDPGKLLGIRRLRSLDRLQGNTSRHV